MFKEKKILKEMSTKQNIQPGNVPVPLEDEKEEETKIKVCLSKNEMLDTIELMLKVCDENNEKRPIMNAQLKENLKRIGGAPLPKDIEKEEKEHEDKLDLFIKNLQYICNKEFPHEYNRLNDNNAGIVYMVLKYGRETDFVRLNEFLDMYESFWDKKTVSKVKADYIIGKKLRNEYINSRLNVTEDNIEELDPDKVDLEKIQKEHPQIFQ